jgi:HK97 gp10 family phage protein
MSDVVFQDHTEEAKAAVRAMNDVALMEAAITMEDFAVQEIQGKGAASNRAVDTGRLAGSIGFRTSTTGGGENPIPGVSKPEDRMQGGYTDHGEACIGTNVDYAQHVEFGTKMMRARPFLEAGVERSIPTVRKVLQARLGQGIDVKWE